MRTKIVSFLTGTDIVGTNIAVTGIGFQPKAVIFFWSGDTGAVDVTGRNTALLGVGFAGSAVDRRCIAIQMIDNVATSDDKASHRNDACVAVFVGAGLDGRLDFVSMDSGGFTVVVDDQFTTSFRIHALCIADVDQVFTGQFQEPAAAGLLSVTEPNFQPDFVMIVARDATTIPGQGGDAHLSLGFAARGSGSAVQGQAVIWAGSEGGVSPEVASRYAIGSGSAVHVSTGSRSIQARYDMESFLSNGFRLNVPERSGTRMLQYLAIRGAKWHVGSFETRTDGTNIPVTGLPFKPDALIFASHCKATSVVDVGDTHARMSIGAATSATERFAVAAFNRDGVTPTQVSRGMEFDEAYLRISDTGTIEGLMDLVSMDASGFTTVMDDTDPDAARVFYVAMGSVIEEEPPPPGSRDALLQPYLSYSIWNLPLGAFANYIFAQISPATARAFFDDPDILVLTKDAPIRTVFPNGDDWGGGTRCAAQNISAPGLPFTTPLPDAFVIPGASGQDTPNRSTSLLASDGVTIIDTQPTARCTPFPGVMTSHYMFPEDSGGITGTGRQGSHGGSQLSALGGTIRLGELVPGGKIPHAIKFNIHEINFSKVNGGFRWPANVADSGAPGGYGNKTPPPPDQCRMGSLLALKPGTVPGSFVVAGQDVLISSLESGPGKIMAQCLLDYGGYNCDSAGWSAYGIPTEYSPDPVTGVARSVAQEFAQVWGFDLTQPASVTPSTSPAAAWARDMQKIMQNLWVVDNWSLADWNTVSASNGALGVGGGPPRVPWAPSLGTGRVLQAFTGVFTLTSQPATLFPSTQPGIVVGDATYAETPYASRLGATSPLPPTHTLVADSGSFALTGQAAGLIRTSRVLLAQEGRFFLTGQPVNLVPPGQPVPTGVVSTTVEVRIPGAGNSWTLVSPAIGIFFRKEVNQIWTAKAIAYAPSVGVQALLKQGNDFRIMAGTQELFYGRLDLPQEDPLYKKWDLTAYGKLSILQDRAYNARRIFPVIPVEVIADEIATSPLDEPRSGMALFYDMETLTLDHPPKVSDRSGHLRHAVARGTSAIVGKWGLARQFDGATDDVTFTPGVPPAGARLRYDMETMSGGLLQDLSGNTNHGTIWGTPAPQSVTGKVGQALSFTPQGGVIGPPGSQLTFTYTGGGLTFSCWVKPDASETDGGFIVSKPWNGSGEYNWGLIFNPNRTIQVRLFGDVYWTSEGSRAALPVGIWTHVTLILRQDRSVEVYLNGELALSSKHTLSNWAPPAGDLNIPLSIGTLYPYGNPAQPPTSFTFNGAIDEVLFYDRDLTSSDAANLAGAGINVPTDLNFGVAGWFRWTDNPTPDYSGIHGGGNSWELRVQNDGKFSIVFYQAIGPDIITAVTSPLAYNDGQWHHACGILRDGIAELYVDGDLVGRAGGAPQNGVKLHYNMETLTGGLMEDLSGNGNHGTIAGAADIAGKYGRGRDFDGVNDDIVVANEGNFEFDNMTVAAWVKPDTFTAENGFPRCIASKSQFSVNNQDWEFIFETDGRPTFRVADFAGNRYSATSPTALGIGEWHHIVGTRAGSTVKIYVDGVLKATITTAPATHNNSSSPVRIGDVDSGVAGHFDGVIDEVYAIADTLSESAIVDLMNASTPRLTSVRASNMVQIGLIASRYKGANDEVRVYTRALSTAEVKMIAGRGIFDGGIVADSFLPIGFRADVDKRIGALDELSKASGAEMFVDRDPVTDRDRFRWVLRTGKDE